MSDSVPGDNSSAFVAPLLEARQITKQFGALTALEDVDFALNRGEVHALLGENGAGKSTLMNVLSGLFRPTSGDIFFDGGQVVFHSPRDAEKCGIGMVHQHFLLIPPLSVAENLLLGASADKGGPFTYPLANVIDEAKALSDRLGWRIPWNTPAGDLPVGTQQRVEILKALRGDTRVLIFDEPTAVLTPTELPELFETIRRLAAEGRGIVFISHKLDEVLSLASRVTVLRRGHVVERLLTADTDAAGLAEAMVGKESDAAAMLASVAAPTGVEMRGEPLAQTGPFALQVSGLKLDGPRNSARPALNGVSFDVANGEIFGIAGVDGNGQAELADCLSGLLRQTSGSITVGGSAPGSDPGSFRRAGVAVIPADRQRRGLALPMTITENMALGLYDEKEYRRGPILRWAALRKHASQLIKEFDIRASGPDSAAKALSGGNQQKIVIARALSNNPKVLIAVNPTRGLDVGAIAYVHGALRTAQAAGVAIVLISTELEEVIALSTRRIAVLYEGAFSGVVAPNAPREEIGLLMGGGTGRSLSADSVS